MPPAQDPNAKAPSIPPALVTAIRYIRDRREQLERLNGAASETTQGHIQGLTAMSALILEAIGEQAGRSSRELQRAVVPAALVAAIHRGRDRRDQLEKPDGETQPGAAGQLVGITDAMALILEAVTDEATNPLSPL